ncbi:Protein kinase-like domain [Pseudocohnilembus persalinus]|uniref:Protein kinase-like domain n=1 Tax=Pseudocohnilembus persalinus TaxID=266149 RepID=A0A0V0QDM5_PSEPJ|nr:Protein kinase-like domain [Pseudocohnilembus persalinus]|eukprot:KRX00303.1 Protein kinase-like domain [Pseudocohnilembus persalinus]
MKSKKAQKNAQFISYTKHPLYQYISNQLKKIANQISESKTKQSNLELFLKQTYQGQNSPQNLELLDFQNFNLNQQQSPKNSNDIENSNLQNKNQQIQHQKQIKEEIDNQLKQLLNNLIQKCKQLHKKETIEKLELDMKNNSLEQLNQSIQQLSEQELKIQLEIFINESEIRLENNLNRMVSYQPPENIKIRKTSYDFCNIFQKSQQSKLKLIETTRNDSNKSDFLPSDNPQSKYYKLYQLSQFQDKNLDSNNSTSPDSNNNSNSSDEEIEEHMNFKLKNYSFYQNWSQEKIKNFKKNFKQFSQKFPQHHHYKTYRNDSDDNQKCKTISNILDQQQSNESLIIEDTDENTEFPRKQGPWGELWEDASQIIIKNSPYSQYKSYQLKSYIIKGDDDVRQEYVAMRLIQTFKQIFQQANLNLWLKDYQIIPTSADSGIIEFLPDTQSIDSIKKKIPGISLDELFKETFLQQKEINTVQDNFMQSLAAYSIICYILQIKDRHNGNILIDSKGHLIHIDFGFILGISPGGISFEKAPFKLTKEYATVLGGKNSDKYQKFEQLFTQGMQEIKKQENIDLIKKELNTLKEEFCDLQCFKKFDEQAFFDRFLDEPSKLLKDSYNNWKTTGYDLFQYTTNDEGEEQKLNKSERQIQQSYSNSSDQQEEEIQLKFQNLKIIDTVVPHSDNDSSFSNQDDNIILENNNQKTEIQTQNQYNQKIKGFQSPNSAKIQFGGQQYLNEQNSQIYEYDSEEVPIRSILKKQEYKDFKNLKNIDGKTIPKHSKSNSRAFSTTISDKSDDQIYINQNKINDFSKIEAYFKGNDLENSLLTSKKQKIRNLYPLKSMLKNSPSQIPSTFNNLKKIESKINRRKFSNESCSEESQGNIHFAGVEELNQLHQYKSNQAPKKTILLKRRKSLDLRKLKKINNDKIDGKVIRRRSLYTTEEKAVHFGCTIPAEPTSPKSIKNYSSIRKLNSLDSDEKLDNENLSQYFSNSMFFINDQQTSNISKSQNIGQDPENQYQQIQKKPILKNKDQSAQQIQKKSQNKFFQKVDKFQQEYIENMQGLLEMIEPQTIPDYFSDQNCLSANYLNTFLQVLKLKLIDTIEINPPLSILNYKQEKTNKKTKQVILAPFENFQNPDPKFQQKCVCHIQGKIKYDSDTENYIENYNKQNMKSQPIASMHTSIQNKKDLNEYIIKNQNKNMYENNQKNQTFETKNQLSQNQQKNQLKNKKKCVFCVQRQKQQQQNDLQQQQFLSLQQQTPNLEEINRINEQKKYWDTIYFVKDYVQGFSKLSYFEDIISDQSSNDLLEIINLLKKVNSISEDEYSELYRLC